MSGQVGGVALEVRSAPGAEWLAQTSEENRSSVTEMLARLGKTADDYELVIGGA